MSTKHKATTLIDPLEQVPTDWTWEVDLTGMIGSYCRLETKEGFRREGKISKVRTHEVKINEDLLQIPVEIELNRDFSDTIPFHAILHMELF